MNNNIIKDSKTKEDCAKLYSIDKFITLYKNIKFIIDAFMLINPCIYYFILFKKYPNIENGIIPLSLYNIFTTTIIVLYFLLGKMYKYFLNISLLLYDVPVEKIKFSKKDRKMIKELYEEGDE